MFDTLGEAQVWKKVHKNKVGGGGAERSQICKNAKEPVAQFQRGGLGPPGGGI